LLASEAVGFRSLLLLFIASGHVLFQGHGLLLIAFLVQAPHSHGPVHEHRPGRSP